MSLIPYTAAAVVIAGAVSTASLATSHDTPPTEALVCALHLSQSGRTVTLLAEAQARQGAHGTYALTVEQLGTGGRTTLRQGGAFHLEPGQRSVLGKATFAARPRDISAELVLEAAGARKTCTTLSL